MPRVRRLHIDRLLWNAKTLRREIVQRYCPHWDAFAEANQRIWEAYYEPRPLDEPWETWQAWLAEYRELVRDVQEMYEEHHGRRLNHRRDARQGVQKRHIEPITTSEEPLWTSHASPVVVSPARVVL
jgi:hypothetical protein